MTIPFRCAARHKRDMKPVAVTQHSKFCVRICLRKQAHYRAREGEWASAVAEAKAEPYSYVCRMLFQAQMSRALNL